MQSTSLTVQKFMSKTHIWNDMPQCANKIKHQSAKLKRTHLQQIYWYPAKNIRRPLKYVPVGGKKQVKLRVYKLPAAQVILKASVENSSIFTFLQQKMSQLLKNCSVFLGNSCHFMRWSYGN